MRKLTKYDVLQFYRTYIAHDSPQRSKLAVHVSSSLDDQATTSSDEVVVTEKLEATSGQTTNDVQQSREVSNLIE